MKSGKVGTYLSQSDKYLLEGDKELADKNYQQASEKFWGAASSIVKAYAELKGVAHDGHFELFQVVSRIAKEENIPEVRKQFSIAGMLHTNFYEGWLTPDQIEDNALEVKEFCNKIKGIILRG